MKKILIVEHKLKSRHILFQLFELFLLPIDLIGYIIEAYKTGRLKYGFGNLSCELRRRYVATLVYPWSIRNYLLHRLGVTLMDFTGKFFKQWYIDLPWTNPDGAKQYIHHFNPFISRRAKQYCLENFHKLS